MPHPMPRVGVHLAFSFVCPTCQTKNYVDPVIMEITAEEAVELEPEIGELPRTGEWVSQPEVVSCANCGATYETINSEDHAPSNA